MEVTYSSYIKVTINFSPHTNYKHLEDEYLKGFMLFLSKINICWAYSKNRETKTCKCIISSMAQPGPVLWTSVE